MQGDHEQDDPGVVMRAIKELLECGHLVRRTSSLVPSLADADHYHKGGNL